MQHDITIIGAAILDILTGPVDNSIFQKGSLPMKNISLSFGGDALNEAVVLSQLGADVELISKVGDDEAGNIVCFASMFVSPILDIKAMERVFEKIKSKPERILVADMTTAKNGETIEDIASLLKYIDYIIPNETEAARLTGEKDVYKNVEMFLEYGANCVIIKRGKKGCLIKTQNQQIEVPAYAGVKVVDTTGAGDSFVSGFIWGLKSGWSLEECGRFGCAVASCTVEEVGANTAIKSLELPTKRYNEMIK